jgi:hypothetical protein
MLEYCTVKETTKQSLRFILCGYQTILLFWHFFNDRSLSLRFKTTSRSFRNKNNNNVIMPNGGRCSQLHSGQQLPKGLLNVRVRGQSLPYKLSNLATLCRICLLQVLSHPRLDVPNLWEWILDRFPAGVELCKANTKADIIGICSINHLIGCRGL